MAFPLVLTSTAPAALPEHGADDAPRSDFIEIARALGAEVSYPAPGEGLLGRIERRTATDLRQAWAARRAGACLYVSLSEKVGLPLALLDRGRTPHVLCAHHLTSARKRLVQRRTGYLRRFDRVLVYSRTQEAYLRGEVCLPPERVRRVYHHVDHRFFTPQNGQIGDYVLSVGREKRDYATLLEAVRPLGVPTILVASSPWSRGEESRRTDLPANVTLRRGLSYVALRDLYDRAALVVLPLQAETDYAAGSTGALEAMAMAKPLVVTGTPGIADYVEDGQTARVVPPADPPALRRAITELLEDHACARRLAAGGRCAVEQGRNLDAYVQTVAEIAGAARERRT
jgi:glycosyltransferase involved in cell wall biosynthesis